MKNNPVFYTDLILLNGDSINIECPEKFHDEFYESIEQAIKRNNALWSPNQFDGCRATYNGIPMDRIAIRHVVGM